MVRTFRKRYIAFRLRFTVAFSREGIAGALIKTVSSLSQNQYSSEIRHIRMISYEPETGVGIVRCNHRLVETLRVSIGKMPETSPSLVSVEVLGVSGTIKALKQKFLQSSLK